VNNTTQKLKNANLKLKYLIQLPLPHIIKLYLQSLTSKSFDAVDLGGRNGSQNVRNLTSAINKQFSHGGPA